MKTTFIYSLSDPRTNQIRYIGKANNPKARLVNHCNPARYRPTYKFNWIKELRGLGLKPILEILDEVPLDNWQFWEKFWIQLIKTWGFSLVNYTDGGDGLTYGNQTSFKKGHRTWNEGTAKPKTLKGNVGKTPESIKNHFKKGSIPWNKNKKGYSTSKKGSKISDEVKKKISKSLIGNESAKKRPVKQYDKNMNLISEFESVTQAKLITGIKSIGNAITGRAKTAGGYIWL